MMSMQLVMVSKATVLGELSSPNVLVGDPFHCKKQIDVIPLKAGI